MIVERLVFKAKFGQGDTVIDAMKSYLASHGTPEGARMRLLVDVTGPMFTAVAETSYPDMAAMLKAQGAETQDYGGGDFQQWFATWSGAVESGSREIYRVVE